MVIRKDGFSESIKEMFFYIIDERWSNHLPFIIATNASGDKFRQAVDMEGTIKVYDRILQMTNKNERILIFNWESHR